VSELLPWPKGQGFPAASSLLCRHSPLASGHVLREFSVSVSLAQTYIRFAMQRFRSHRTYSGCSLPTVAYISPRNAPYQGADLPGSTLSLRGIMSWLGGENNEIYIVDLCGANVIRAKDSAFILWLTFRQPLPRTSVRETTLKDGDFPLRLRNPTS